MEAWKEKWKEMTRFRQILLVLMAAMVVVFAVANAVACSRPGLRYGDTLLYPEHTGESRRYSGRVEGVDALLTIHPDGTVEYRWGEHEYGPYQVVEDPSAAPKDFWGSGIEIRQGEEVLFRGGYTGDSTFPLRDENGEPVWKLSFEVSGGTHSYYVDGKPASDRQWHEPSLSTIARWALEPEKLTHRGGFGLYLIVTMLALLNMAQICFPGFFFRLSLCGHVRNREQAEPSDLYIFMEQAEWIMMTVVCLVLYMISYTTIR